MGSKEQYVEFFKKCDTDGSGSLSKDELSAMLRNNGYTGTDYDFEKIFFMTDSSGDGKISLDEYLVAMGAQPKPKHQGAAMRRVFKAFDKNGDGFIDKAELKAVFAEMGKHFSDAELKRMIELADEDGSGTLDCKEFIKKVFGVDA